jgi:arylsulfatase A-like enzyme
MYFDDYFFLNMAHYAVHTPIEAHKRLVKHYQNRVYQDTQINIPEVEKNYASLVEGVDDSLGALMKHLNVLGIAENTLVIFTSDNGGLSGHTRETTPRGTELNSHNWPLNAGKGSAFEGGTRVPYIVAWAKPQAKNHYLMR